MITYISNPAVALITIFINYVSVFTIAKILIKDWEPQQKEIIYVIASGLFVSTIGLFAFLTIYVFFIMDLALVFFLLLYLYKQKRYTVKKSFILIFISLLIFTTGSTSWPLTHNALLYIASYLPLHIVFFIFTTLTFPLYILITVIFVNFTEELRAIINQSKRTQTLLLCILVIIIVLFRSPIFLFFLFPLEHEFYFSIISAFLFVVPIFAFTSVFTLLTLLKRRYERQSKEAELINLQYYINEIEQQYTAVRKFEHDYHNILLSIDGFLETNNLAGLKQYYSSKVKTASESIAKNNIAVLDLCKIKATEIKSILSAKLMLAQSLGIDTRFESNEDIVSFPIDSIMLVRMLGIIMDNAIEALTEQQDRGVLQVSCFNGIMQTTLVVENTCNIGMLDFSELSQEGFSTKGEGRGLGLCILLELIDANPNVTLETYIKNDCFVQKIIMRKDVTRFIYKLDS